MKKPVDFCVQRLSAPLLFLACVAPASCAREKAEPTKVAAVKIDKESKIVSKADMSQAVALYGQKIVLLEGANADLKAAAADTLQTLQAMTGREFAVAAAAADSGIFLLRADDAAAPAAAKKRLAGKGREAFDIRSADKNKLFIVANRDEGLAHGLYFYLEQLGARFYFPTDNWTIIPHKTDITLKIDRTLAPDFRGRNFFGTGGFGRLSLDPKNSVQISWEKWKKRNRFGGEYTLGGHSGEAFNTEKKAILLEHPEYLAKVNGNYVPWTTGAKLNTANPEAIKLYTEWALERYRRARKANPDAPGSFSVSVDPSDGGGHCNSDECKKIGNGSPSDQTFYIANQVAKAVRAEFPDGYVNLYAYNEHAAVPSFPLEPNVFISVIPYAFQRTGLSGEELIRSWGAKVKRIGIYDYWGMADWYADLPTFDFRGGAQKKLRMWHENNIESFTGESSNSAGAMGLAWYVASRLMWDLKTDPQPIISEFYEKAFGPSKVPMQRMMDRWANGFLLINNDLALSYRDLAEAQKLAQGDQAVLRRLADYGRYLEYLRLRHDWLIAAPAEKPAAARALARHVWRIYPSEMIHSFRMFQAIARGNQELLDAYAYQNLDAPGWKDTAPMQDDEALRLVVENARKLQPLDFVTRQFKGALVPLPKELLPAPSPSEAVPMFFTGSVSFQIEVAPGQKLLNFKLGSQKATRVQLLDADGRLISERSAPANAPEAKTDLVQEISVPVAKPGRYNLKLLQEKNTGINVEFPRAARVTLEPFTTPKQAPSPTLYFWVPKGVRNIVISEQGGLSPVMLPRLWDSSGGEATMQYLEGGYVLLYPVPAGQDGKVWKIARLTAPNQPAMLLNAPNVFAFSPSDLLVPQDALK